MIQEKMWEEELQAANVDKSSWISLFKRSRKNGNVSYSGKWSQRDFFFNNMEEISAYL